ncbi:hypothetical protein N566_17240 [Streptomycetaceae bacterium MP113-05]|nr:hypothetical protein N566_17240 [Streptomycetaceae bacterium MP113-05]
MCNDVTQGSLSRVHGSRPGLPRGRSSLPAEVVGPAQRDRLIRAMIAATAELGYAQVMVADVVKRARVSRKTFYVHFADKEECFLAANDLGVEQMFTRIAVEVSAAAEGQDGPDAVVRLRAGLRGYLCFLSDEPEFARTFLVEGLAAGPRALERFEAAHRRFADLTRRWYERALPEHEGWPAVPPDAYTAIVGALHELVTVRVRGGRTAELPTLEDTALRIHLALLTGWPTKPDPGGR